MDDPEDLSAESFQGLFTVNLREDLVKILRDSEQNFRVLVDLLPICLMMHRGGKIVYANPGLVRLLGYEKAGELVGQSPLILVPPEDREKIQKRINRISEQGEAHNPLVEQILFKKNGEKLFAEVESIAVIHQGVPAVMALFRDATQRKKAEEALQSSEENFKAMMERMPDGILIGDMKQVLFVNAQLMRMLGYKRKEELIGQEVLSLIHPDYRDFARERARVAYGKAAINPLMEYQWLAKDGRPVDIEASSISIQYEGKPAVLAALRDITERKKSEGALLQTEKSFKAMIEQMADGVVILEPDRVLFVNSSFARMLGYEREEELTGRPPPPSLLPRFKPSSAKESLIFTPTQALAPSSNTPSSARTAAWWRWKFPAFPPSMGENRWSCPSSGTSPSAKKPRKPFSNPKKVSRP
jgi:PAS domain S-box-containing protein